MKPMLFSTEMVRALLRDVNPKTQTRRIVKPKYRKDEAGYQVCTIQKTGERWVEKYDDDEMGFDPPRYVNPPYQVGDILWVRETWAGKDCYQCPLESDPYDYYPCVLDSCPCPFDKQKYFYRADHNFSVDIRRWRPSIHMPKEASRIFLRVTDIRVERIQDIDDIDIYKEGIPAVHDAYSERLAFSSLWDDIYGEGAWERNDWVWVYEFKRCEKPQGGAL